MCYLYMVYNKKINSRKYNSDKFEISMLFTYHKRLIYCINFSHYAMTLTFCLSVSKTAIFFNTTLVKLVLKKKIKKYCWSNWWESTSSLVMVKQLYTSPNLLNLGCQTLCTFKNIWNLSQFCTVIANFTRL